MTEKVREWLHLNSDGNVVWVEPIWRAVGNAADLPRDTICRGMSINIRLRLLKHLIRRLNEDAKTLFKSVRGFSPKHVCTTDEPMCGQVFKVDHNLHYAVVSDVESLLFQLSSFCELLKEFTVKMHAAHGTPVGKQRSKTLVKEICEASGHTTDWFTLLDKERNFLAHTGAWHEAINVTDGRFDLLLAKDNIGTYTDPSQFTTLHELNRTVEGAIDAAREVQRHIVSLFEKQDDPNK